MERLIEGKGDNSPETYNKIFQERQERGLDWQDVRRWKKMLKYFKGGEILDVGCLDSLILEFANEDKYPMLGVGIDENTAIIVQADTLEVIGNSYVLIYDKSFWSREGSDLKHLPNENDLFYFLRAGDRYNLVERKIIEK